MIDAVKTPEVVCSDRGRSSAAMSDILCVRAHQLCYQVTGALLPRELAAQVTSMHTKVTEVIRHNAV